MQPRSGRCSGVDKGICRENIIEIMEYFKEKKMALISAKDLYYYKKVKVIIIDLHTQGGYGVIVTPEMNNRAFAELLAGERIWESP